MREYRPGLRFRFIRATSTYLGALRHDEVLPFIHARDLAGTDHGGAVELVEDCRSCKAQADIEPLALIDWTVDFPTVEPHAPTLAPSIAEAGPGRLECRHCHRRHK